MKTLNNETNRKTLRNYGLSNLKVDDSDFDYDEINEKTVYIREFTISFSRRLNIAG